MAFYKPLPLQSNIHAVFTALMAAVCASQALSR